MGELDNPMGGGGVLKSLVHSIILREQALFLGCENWDRYGLVKRFVW